MGFSFAPSSPLSIRSLLILGLALAFGCGMAHAAPVRDPVPATSKDSAQAPAAGIDQKAIHDEYVNGNFETVIARITAFLKENPEHSRADSLFIARHLAVVHAADPKTVEAGKYWMYRLILLSPTADLSGMYVSEEIERMFERVKKETQLRSGGNGRGKWVWIGAGGAVLAAAAAAWLILDEKPHAADRTIVPVLL